MTPIQGDPRQSRWIYTGVLAVLVVLGSGRTARAQIFDHLLGPDEFLAIQELRLLEIPDLCELVICRSRYVDRAPCMGASARCCYVQPRRWGSGSGRGFGAPFCISCARHHRISPFLAVPAVATRVT